MTTLRPNLQVVVHPKRINHLPRMVRKMVANPKMVLKVVRKMVRVNPINQVRKRQMVLRLPMDSLVIKTKRRLHKIHPQMVDSQSNKMDRQRTTNP